MQPAVSLLCLYCVSQEALELVPDAFDHSSSDASLLCFIYCRGKGCSIFSNMQSKASEQPSLRVSSVHIPSLRLARYMSRNRQVLNFLTMAAQMAPGETAHCNKGRNEPTTCEAETSKNCHPHHVSGTHWNRPGREKSTLAHNRNL